MRLLPLVLSACLVPLPALAQGRDPAGAEKLYDDGSKLLAADDWAGACAKFEQSFALDAAPGTLLNLASCAEHDGKIALAWSRLKDARSLNLDTKSETRKKQIESFVAAAIARLEPRLPYLTVKLKATAPGVTVMRDGQPTAIDVELPIDPGKHVIEATAEGMKPLKREVVSVEGARETITLELEPAPKETPPIEPKQLPPPPPETKSPVVPEPSSGMSPLRIGGIVVGSVGIAALGVTIATGVLALGKQGELDDLGCRELEDGNLGCSPATADKASKLSSSGSTLAIASTVTTFVGVGLVGAGVLMIVLGDSSPETPKATGLRVLPMAGPGHASLWLTGSF